MDIFYLIFFIWAGYVTTNIHSKEFSVVKSGHKCLIMQFEGAITLYSHINVKEPTNTFISLTKEPVKVDGTCGRKRSSISIRGPNSHLEFFFSKTAFQVLDNVRFTIYGDTEQSTEGILEMELAKTNSYFQCSEMKANLSSDVSVSLSDIKIQAFDLVNGDFTDEMQACIDPDSENSTSESLDRTEILFAVKDSTTENICLLLDMQAEIFIYSKVASNGSEHSVLHQFFLNTTNMSAIGICSTHEEVIDIEWAPNGSVNSWVLSLTFSLLSSAEENNILPSANTSPANINPTDGVSNYALTKIELDFTIDSNTFPEYHLSNSRSQKVRSDNTLTLFSTPLDFSLKCEEEMQVDLDSNFVLNIHKIQIEAFRNSEKKEFIKPESVCSSNENRESLQAKKTANYSKYRWFIVGVAFVVVLVILTFIYKTLISESPF